RGRRRGCGGGTHSGRYAPAPGGEPLRQELDHAGSAADAPPHEHGKEFPGVPRALRRGRPREEGIEARIEAALAAARRGAVVAAADLRKTGPRPRRGTRGARDAAPPRARSAPRRSLQASRPMGRGRRIRRAERIVSGREDVTEPDSRHRSAFRALAREHTITRSKGAIVKKILAALLYSGCALGGGKWAAGLHNDWQKAESVTTYEQR